MASVTLLGSFDNGHTNCTPRETITASSDCFVEDTQTVSYTHLTLPTNREV